MDKGLQNFSDRVPPHLFPHQIQLKNKAYVFSTFSLDGEGSSSFVLREGFLATLIGEAFSESSIVPYVA